MLSTAKTRRLVAGTSLILFPLLLLASEALDPLADDAGAAGLYAAAVDDHTQLVWSALLLMASSIFLIPAAFGLAQMVTARGAWLMHFGVFFAVLGALGHAAAATYYLIGSVTRTGDREAMVALLERVDSSGAIAAISPLIFAFAVAALFLALAVWRARLASGLVPIAIVAALVVEFASPALPESAALVKQALALVAFGRLGITILTLSDDEWQRQSPAAFPTAHEPAHGRETLGTV